MGNSHFNTNRISTALFKMTITQRIQHRMALCQSFVIQFCNAGGHSWGKGEATVRWKGFMVGGEEDRCARYCNIVGGMAFRPIDPRPARHRGQSGLLVVDRPV